MLDHEKQEFFELMRSTLTVYGQGLPTNDVFKIWWNALSGYEFAAVRKAFAEHISKDKFAPRPASILEILNEMEPDGRPSADEAWAIYPKDEYASAVVTNEMHEAMAHASELGDQVAARMAFKAAYERITATNKRNGVKPVWRPSLGFDKEQHASVLAEGIRLGRIGKDHALGLARPQDVNEVMQMAQISDNKLLPNMPKNILPEIAKQNIEKIKAMLHKVV